MRARVRALCVRVRVRTQEENRLGLGRQQFQQRRRKPAKTLPCTLFPKEARSILSVAIVIFTQNTCLCARQVWLGKVTGTPSQPLNYKASCVLDS